MNVCEEYCEVNILRDNNQRGDKTPVCLEPSSVDNGRLYNSQFDTALT